MIYRIRYEQAGKEKHQRKNGRLLLLTVGFFLLFLCCAQQRYPQEMDTLISYLISLWYA